MTYILLKVALFALGILGVSSALAGKDEYEYEN